MQNQANWMLIPSSLLNFLGVLRQQVYGRRHLFSNPQGSVFGEGVTSLALQPEQLDYH